jgi:o-succinylbenzoate synthase
MLKAKYQPYQLKFKTPGGTSRGVLTQKSSWFISVWDDVNPDLTGIGECSILPGLSPDDHPELEKTLKEVCDNIHILVSDTNATPHLQKRSGKSSGAAETHNMDQPRLPFSQSRFHLTLANWPAIRFAIETALIDLKQGGQKILFPSPFADGREGIPINGLIWMGTPVDMVRQIEEKLKTGFRCLKIKIGAIDFQAEYSILKNLRTHFPETELELRVDANGAFTSYEVPEILHMLASLDIHSIEQPIPAGQWQNMAQICESSPLPVALDEELTGIDNAAEKERMIETIRPQYIILKPSLTGGFTAAEQWIKTAEKHQAGWWVTSALESNIGLNAIAQWTYTLHNALPQGLGTGQVFSNNIPSPLTIKNGQLWRQS